MINCIFMMISAVTAVVVDKYTFDSRLTLYVYFFIFMLIFVIFDLVNDFLIYIAFLPVFTLCFKKVLAWVEKDDLLIEKEKKEEEDLWKSH